MKKLERDGQRGKMYRAERVLDHHEVRFADIAEAQAYLDAVLASAWFRKRWPHVRAITVIRGRRDSRRAWAKQNARVISLPPWALGSATVLHEIAHVCTPPSAAWHGREYSRTFLMLVRRYMGEPAYRQLRAAFIVWRVRHQVRQPMSAERRERMALVLAAAREKISG